MTTGEKLIEAETARPECGHAVHWWFGESECDRRAGHSGPHAVVGSDLRWNGKGDQIFVGPDRRRP